MIRLQRFQFWETACSTVKMAFLPVLRTDVRGVSSVTVFKFIATTAWFRYLSQLQDIWFALYTFPPFFLSNWTDLKWLSTNWVLKSDPILFLPQVFELNGRTERVSTVALETGRLSDISFGFPVLKYEGETMGIFPTDLLSTCEPENVARSWSQRDDEISFLLHFRFVIARLDMSSVYIFDWKHFSCIYLSSWGNCTSK